MSAWRPSSLADLLRSISNMKQVEEAGGQERLRVAADLIDETFPRKPLVTIVQGDAAEFVPMTLRDIEGELDRIRDSIGSLTDTVENLRHHLLGEIRSTTVAS